MPVTYLLIQARIPEGSELPLARAGDALESRLFTGVFKDTLRNVFEFIAEADLQDPRGVACGGTNFLVHYGLVLKASDPSLTPTGFHDLLISVAATIGLPSQPGVSGEEEVRRALRDPDCSEECAKRLLNMIGVEAAPPLTDISCGVDRYEDEIAAGPIPCYALTHCFIRYSGMLLSRVERDALIIDISAGNRRDVERNLAAASKLSAATIHLRRLFLSKTLSGDGGLDAFAEHLRTAHRIGDRHTHLLTVVTEVGDHLNRSLQKIGVGMLRVIEFILAAFAIVIVPVTVYFGAFAIREDAPILGGEGGIVWDGELVLMLYVAAGAAILIAVSAFIYLILWGKIRRGRREDVPQLGSQEPVGRHGQLPKTARPVSSPQPSQTVSAD